MADKFVRDPHDVVAVGDIVKVWVMEVDKERRRVSLTMVRPGTERAKQPHYGGKPGGERPATEGADRRATPRGDVRRVPPVNRVARPANRDARPASKDIRPVNKRRPPRPQGRGRPEREYHRPPPRPRPAPKPMIPITDAMKVGKEPMRTFGDLLQFYQGKPATPVDHPPPAAEPSSSVPPEAGNEGRDASGARGNAGGERAIASGESRTAGRAGSTVSGRSRTAGGSRRNARCRQRLTAR